VFFESLPAGEDEPVGQRNAPPKQYASPGVGCDVGKGVKRYDYQEYSEDMTKGVEQASAVVLVLEAVAGAGTDRMAKPAAYGGARSWDEVTGEVMYEPPVDKKDYGELEYIHNNTPLGCCVSYDIKSVILWETGAREVPQS